MSEKRIRNRTKTMFNKLTKLSKATLSKFDMDATQIDVDYKVIHTGRVLSIDDVNKNRSSKYEYLAF